MSTSSPLEIPPLSDFPSKPDELEHPPQPSTLYDFTRLPNPPNDWSYFDVKFEGIAQGRSRSLKLPQLQVLMKHYFWGIHYEETTKTVMTTRKKQNLRVQQSILFKLIYYMQERHRPKTWLEMLNINRDTGPRLLRYDLDPRPKPLSRWYTSPPDVSTPILSAYIRPLDAPPDMPDHLIQQYMYSVDSLYTPPPPPPPPAPTVDAQEEEILRMALLQHMNPGVQFTPAYSLTDPPGTTIPGPEPGQKRGSDENTEPRRKRSRQISPGAPAYRGRPRSPTPPFQEPVFAADEITTFTWMPGLEPSHTVAPIGKHQLSPIVPKAPGPVDTRELTDAIERAVMQIVYADLDRDPSIPSTEKPIRHGTAQSYQDMLKLKLGSFPTTANVKLSPLTFDWDPNGTLFPVRGRGPIWDAMSCATDAVIVAGMLLDAGCTKIDRANNRAAEFKDIEKAFIEVTMASWETFDDKTSIFVRDEWLRMCTERSPGLKMGQPIPPWAVWSVATRSFAQFRYFHVERVTPCKCQRTIPFYSSHQGSCILPGYQPGDEKGVELQVLIERCFYPRKSFKCDKCGDAAGVTGERKIGQLPLRLVVTSDIKTRIRNHTENLKFNYIDYEDKQQVAHYRWLGGIYNNESHARLFWTDTQRGEKDDGNIMMYDSQVNSGVLIGGIPAFQREERVPTEWVNHHAIPLLFYERIMNPSGDLLSKANNAMSEINTCVNENKNLLEEHIPWKRSTPPLQQESWPRVLSYNGERFSSFNPGWATAQPSPNLAAAQTAMPSLTPAVPIDPALLDPSVLDPSLIDQSIYSTTTPPEFDLSSFIDVAMMDEVPTINQDVTEDPTQEHIFDSMMQSPRWLAQNPDMWPSGIPDEEGALDFPELPTTPYLGSRNGTGRSNIPMPDAGETIPGLRNRVFRSTHGNGLQRSAIATYAIAKQALSASEKDALRAEKMRLYRAKQRFSDAEDEEEEKEVDQERLEIQRRQEKQEHDRKRREEQKKQEDLDKKKREKREKQKELEKNREQQKQESEVPEKDQKWTREESYKQQRRKEEEKKEAEKKVSRRPGLRNSRKKNTDPTWKPGNSGDEADLS
ncbi:unnamed protein product [Penicillium nalgiovense]|uniref:Uncharacterized protein n=1 Tax=Penicillium nalgiovense TaxID=60175 RepID=A0A9W4MSW6_PENNA|nr:unnamed protein product [Penicillium nalgiovense]CAG8077599.1 unnamed protein product [Penicillium nalgiovense]CAG8082842.1 unnamed protein product [Penicillium nalgiovense]CAG8091139.1 unnamed protein product [Penicillium nalgiovense]CAG8092368.1 unnamed protein product [Penicillium nalgiovense]